MPSAPLEAGQRASVTGVNSNVLPGRNVDARNEKASGADGRDEVVESQTHLVIDKR